eukprot:s395_g21.t1
MNKKAHSDNGNTVSSQQPPVQRAKWESTVDHAGVTLLHEDELKVPGDSALQILCSDQVANSATGVAFVHTVWLPPKLKVQGGHYLLLLLPGRLGGDLRSILPDAGPDMIGKTFETTLSLEDPHTKRQFVRNVVGINLGLQHVKPGELKASAQPPTDDSVIAVVHAYQRQRHNVEAKHGRSNFGVWGVKCEDQKLQAFTRVKPAELLKLRNSKDLIVFFRHFVAPGTSPPQEKDVVLLWATKISNGEELSKVSNTLKGIHGFIANKSSLGVRVSKDALGPARLMLVKTNSRFNQVNQNVAGDLRWIAHGFPPQWSAQAIVEVMSTPADDGQWEPWHVVPYRSITQQQRTS